MLKKILSLLNYKSFFKKENSLETLKNNPEAKFLFSCFEKKTKDINVIKFVGGCIRQAIIGEFAEDLDLATTLKPDEVKECLKENNINFYETGYEHGTITAILNNQKFEITSLREDIVTDGRHAKVRFTSDWEKDSSRRDFTINSIYMNIIGDIYDPNNGISDLKLGIIRFIGNDERRISEDYLRILRYVRFYLQYGKTQGMEYLVLDGHNLHNQMLIHVFENEEEYPFLKKIFEKEIKPTFLKEFKNFIFGSIEDDYPFHVKAFKIDYNEFENIRKNG